MAEELVRTVGEVLKVVAPAFREILTANELAATTTELPTSVGMRMRCCPRPSSPVARGVPGVSSKLARPPRRRRERGSRGRRPYWNGRLLPGFRHGGGARSGAPGWCIAEAASDRSICVTGRVTTTWARRTPIGFPGGRRCSWFRRGEQPTRGAVRSFRRSPRGCAARREAWIVHACRARRAHRCGPVDGVDGHSRVEPDVLRSSSERVGSKSGIAPGSLTSVRLSVRIV